MDTSLSKKDLSVVIMAFNEVQTIRGVVSDADFILRNLGLSYEVLIIDDGSRDSTGEICDKLAKEFAAIAVIHSKQNLGLGNVYSTAFDKAHGEFLTFYPADGQFPLSNIAEFIPLMKDYDLILGNIKEAKSSWASKVLAKCERLILRLIFGEFPYFKGIIMFRRNILDNIQLRSSGRAWMVLMELLIKAYRRGFKINSISVVMRPRAHGKSKVNNIKTVASFLGQIFSLKISLLRFGI